MNIQKKISIKEYDPKMSKRTKKKVLSILEKRLEDMPYFTI